MINFAVSRHGFESLLWDVCLKGRHTRACPSSLPGTLSWCQCSTGTFAAGTEQAHKRVPCPMSVIIMIPARNTGQCSPIDCLMIHLSWGYFGQEPVQVKKDCTSRIYTKPRGAANRHQKRLTSTTEILQNNSVTEAESEQCRRDSWTPRYGCA